MDRAIEEFHNRRAERLNSRYGDYESVKAFRERRARRLDEKEPDSWISTEDGTHIPLDENGKAIGGPLKGEDFSDAKASVHAGGKKMGEKRKQIDLGHGLVEDGELPYFNKKALEKIKEETEYDDEKAEELQKCMIEYLGGDYHSFRYGKKKKEEEIIDNGLARMGTYDGTIYRGMTFFDNEDDKKAFEELCALEVGDEMKMMSVSSWTSDEMVGLGFGEVSNHANMSVVLTCKNNKSGVGVQHISKFRDTESEVLAPSKAKWRVTGKKIVSKLEIADEMEKRYNKMLEDGVGDKFWIEDELDAIAQLRARSYTASGRKVLYLEVEEIGD